MKTRFDTVAATLLTLLGSAPLVAAQTLSTWSGGTGDWRDAAKWTPNGVPNGAATDVVVDGTAGSASVVTFGTNTIGTNYRIGRLLIDAGDTVQFGSAGSTLFWDNAAFPGAGSLTINGLLHLPYSSGKLTGTKSITGTGTLRLGGTGQQPQILDKTTNAALIQGSALFGAANASWPQIINSGIIEANLPGQDINIHGQGGANRSVNTGTLRAVGGGRMQLGQGEWLNTGGLVTADGAGSQVAFYRAGVLEGGTIAATNGGALQVGGSFYGSSNGGYRFKDVTLNGPMNLQDTILITGTLSLEQTVAPMTNHGIINIPAGFALLDASRSAGVTISGGDNNKGQIVLDSPNDGEPELINQGNSSVTSVPWLFDGVTVRGRGNVGSPGSMGSIDNVVITNQGTFQADVDGGTLLVDVSGFDNQSGGVLRATGSGDNPVGGILRLALNRPLTNNGGMIEASNGGRVEASAARIEGGLIRALPKTAAPAARNGNTRALAGEVRLGGMTLVNPGTGMTLEGDLTLGMTGANQEAHIIGEIENKGILRVAASTHFARLRLGNSPTRTASLTGGGQLILGDPVSGSMESGLMEWSTTSLIFTLTNTDHTISGFGRIGDPGHDRWLTLVNKGAVTATVPDKTLQIELYSAINTGGTFSASGGGRISIWARSGFNNTGGTVEALAGSKAAFLSTEINGGTITSAATGTLEFPDFNLGKGGVAITNAGTTIFGASGGTREFSGLANGGSTFNNLGTIRKTGSGDYTVRTQLNSPSGGRFNVESGTLRNFGGGTINSNVMTIAGPGAILAFQGAPSHIFSGDNKFSGGGIAAIVDTTAVLADASTTLAAHNFRFQNATLSGPGLLTHTGQMDFFNTSATLDGVRVSTLPPATALVEVRDFPFNLINGAKWQNEGRIVLRNSGKPTITGAPGTKIENRPGGVLRYEGTSFGIFNIETQNEGKVEVASGTISFEKPTAWTGGTATVASGAGLWIKNAPMTVNGQANAVTGEGWLSAYGSGSLNLPTASRLTADRLALYETSSISGPGELHIAKAAEWRPPSGGTHVINGTQVQLLAGSTNVFDGTGRTLRLEQNAALRNAGTMQFTRAIVLKLESGGLFENAGTTEFNPSGTGNQAFVGSDDGTGLFRTLTGSTTRFVVNNASQMSFGVPIELAGQVIANTGYQVTFTKGGLFNGDAKLNPVGTSSEIKFTGAASTYTVRGRGHELNGAGYVTFLGTKLVFDDPTPANPDDNPKMEGSAKVALHGDNNIEGKGSILTGGGIAFEGNLNLKQSLLRTLAGSVSTWNATNGNILLSEGAVIENDGTWTILKPVGKWEGPAGTFISNLENGRLVHDSNSITNINVRFVNSGLLEFRKGTINFKAGYEGPGGIAVSGGSKVDLGTTAFTDPANLPSRLQASGIGSELKLTLASGQIFEVKNPDAIKAGPGAKVTLDGGLRTDVKGPIGSAGAQGVGAILGILGGSLIGQDGSTLFAKDGGSLIGQDGSTLIGMDGSTLIGMDGGSLIGMDGGSLIGQDGSTLIGQDGSTLAAIDGGDVGVGSPPVAGLRSRGASPRGPAKKQARLLTQPGANVKAIGGGSIIVNPNGVVIGGGTFTGPGVVKGGGSIRPGNGAGFITWNGNLTFESESLLEMEIGGTAAATEHDRINVSSAFVMNGQLTVSFVNGFGPGLTPASTFDMVVATGGVTSTLAGTRMSVKNAYGSFLVSIVNGTTLRLSDYQPVPATFNRWAQRFGLTGADALPEADPNRSGLSNLMKYALGLEASASGNQGTSHGIFEDGQGNRYLTLSNTKPAGPDAPSDLLYESQRAASVTSGPWSGLAADVVPTGPAVPGPGNLETVTVRSTHTIGSGQPSDFLRLRVVLQSP